MSRAGSARSDARRRFWRRATPIALARFDDDAEAPWRGADGFCARCAIGETGEALGRIGAEPSQRFEGYSQREETKRRSCATCSSPATPGCAPATSCAATPRASIISSTASATRFAGKARTSRRWKSPARSPPRPESSRAIVYGVAVPGADGRAGMALLAADGAPDLEDFARALESLAALRPAAVPALPALARGDRDLQAQAARDGGTKASTPPA